MLLQVRYKAHFVGLAKDAQPLDFRGLFAELLELRRPKVSGSNGSGHRSTGSKHEILPRSKASDALPAEPARSPAARKKKDAAGAAKGEAAQKAGAKAKAKGKKPGPSQESFAA